MIAHVRGRVTHREAGRVVVDVHGVGYLVHVPATERIPPRGEEVELATSLQVREDSMTLYGFTTRAALELFELLLSSSGVGPKLALAALGTHAPDTLRAAIGGEDVATLTQVPGIGKKVAERLVLELRDKVGVVAGLPETSDAGAARADGGPGGEAREALLALGYTPAEAQTALATVNAALGTEAATLDTSELLRRCLRELAGAAHERSRT
jgi:holliday junction DNA helicase RuvA